MKNIALLVIYKFLAITLFAQVGEEPQQENDGRKIQLLDKIIVGKLIDKQTGKPVEAASVQLFLNDSLIGGMLSRPNGDFSFSKLPSVDSLKIVVSTLGYQEWRKSVTIGSESSSYRKDLGNITLDKSVQELGEVTVSSSRPALELGVDRRVFNVDKSLTSAGGTAIDILKNIPSVTVGIDGSVELRNSSPQVFVDGRPTILTLDQIPADNIEKIELITNPSAKFDASSAGGIINVVLKKSKRAGLNGLASISGGTPKLFSTNLNINLRQNKFNFFVNGGYNHSGGISRGRTLRQNKENGIVTDYFNQYSRQERTRKFSSIRFGADYFIDNRNTITVSQDFFNGRFDNDEVQNQQYLNNQQVLEYFGTRTALSNAKFDRRSTRMNFKHTFQKDGQELTADAIYNVGGRSDRSEIENFYFNPDGSSYDIPKFVSNNGRSREEQLTLQSDYVNPISESLQIETGIRSFHNKFWSFYDAFANNNGQLLKLPLSNNYEFSEMVNAGYFTLTQKKKNFSYQVGLRAEHSRFTGLLVDSAFKFGYEYPNRIDRIWDALFPSLFLTRKIGEDDELQLNYSRRIRRPRFGQLNPIIEISDPTNLRQGNPQLKPEFVNSFELNYNKNYRGGSFLGSIYYRNNPNDITQYSDTISASQYQQLNNAAVDPNAILSTFINATTTNRYGVELTWQHKFNPNFDLTPTVELEYQKVNANVTGIDLSNEGVNWEAKLIANYKIADVKSRFFNNFSFQLTGEYESPQVIPQGKQLAQYVADFAIRKDFMKNNRAGLTFAINDVFNSRRWGTIYDTDQFYQDAYNRWNVRNFRLTFSLKFGDANFSFSKRGDSNGDDDD
jgi:outer membrane receptor protein involved in Fe transport